MGEKQTGPDIPNSAKPGQDKPDFFKVIDAVVGAIPAGAKFCSAVTSTIGGYLVSGLGALLGATGPVSFFASLVVDIVGGYALQPFISDIIKWIAGQQVPTDVAGATLGNFANYGARLAANDVSTTHGGIAVGTLAANNLKIESYNQIATEFKHKPLFYKLFNRSDPDSTISKIMPNQGFSANQHSIANTLTSFPSVLKKTAALFGTVAHPRVLAATTAYDYGFPEYGYTLGEIDNPTYDDPYTNAAIVEQPGRLATLNDKYGKDCFGLTIDPLTFAITTSAQMTQDRYVNQSNTPAIATKCNDRSNTELTQYRFYIADLTAAKAIACYESIDEDACTELGFGTQPVTATTTSSPTKPNPPTINKFVHTGASNSNTFLYNVSSASSCYIQTLNPPASQQPFSPTLNADSGVTAGNGGSGTLICVNQNSDPATKVAT